MRSRRPPKRLCRLCGGDVYSWQEDALCKACKPELDTGVGGLVREQHLTRTPPVAAQGRRITYGEFPEGF